MAKGIEIASADVNSTPIKDKTLTTRVLSPKSKIEGEGSVKTNGSGNASFNIPHNLGYPPAHLIFFNPGNATAVLFPGMIASWVDAMTDSTWGLMDNFIMSVYAYSNQLTGYITNGVPDTTYRYKYFIFAERAET
jgi:hypothetical protein